jgi:hypothetical protein
MAPEPTGFSREPIRPRDAFYNKELKEFLLMYDRVREAPHPEDLILQFAQSTYEAGARLSAWDREALEWPPARDATVHLSP